MISIIVPIYKVEKYIRQCVESIIAQTYDDIEIILVDDGSPDNCPSICDEYAKKDSRIKVVHQENRGLIEARKSGLRASDGEYVCFVDGDDWIEPQMYQRIADAINSYRPDAVITQFYYSYEDREVPSDYKLSKPLYTRKEIEEQIFPSMLFCPPFYTFGIFPNCWTKVFRKEILEKHLFDVDSRIRMGEDIAFTYPCIMECKSLAFVDEPLYHYRINPQSMTNSYDSRLKDIYSIPYETLVRKSNELNVDLLAQLPYYLLYLVNFVIRNEANSANPSSKAEKRAVLKELLNNDFNLIDKSVLPFHTKILLICLKSKKVSAVEAYMKLIRRFM